MTATLADWARLLNFQARAAGADPALPPILLLTDTRRLPDPETAILHLPAGSAVILRDYDHPARPVLGRRLLSLCRRRGVRLLVASDARLAAALKADGLHLPEGLAARPACWQRWRRPGWLVTASAHSPRALARARAIGADAALLSPVFPTASHPGAPALGAALFARWCRAGRLPVYALGGIDAVTVRRLKGSGAAGVAGIGAVAGLENAAPSLIHQAPQDRGSKRA